VPAKQRRGRYDSGPWRQVRQQILARDNHRCQIGGKGCTGRADTVDHIVELEKGGDRLDPHNLRAACRHCNSARSANLAAERWRVPGRGPEGRRIPRIVLVVGPPCGGKTQWVKQGGTQGAVVVDLDALQVALGGEARGSGGHWNAAMGARGGVLKALRRGEVDAELVYLISANPNAEALFPYHDVVLCDPGLDEVLRRYGGGGRWVPTSLRSHHLRLVPRT